MQKGEAWFTQRRVARPERLPARRRPRLPHLLDLRPRRRLLVGTYNYLDLTALGRQEDWEEPRGRSDGPFMHWVRHHDEYGQAVPT